MLAHLFVFFRYLLVALFAGIGGALAERGFIDENAAGLLTSDAFIEAAAWLASAFAVFIYYLFFSASARANEAWNEARQIVEDDDFDPEEWGL